jgi:hypothetical protein
MEPRLRITAFVGICIQYIDVFYFLLFPKKIFGFLPPLVAPRMSTALAVNYRFSSSVPPNRYRYTESKTDRLCGLVVRVLGCRSGGPGSITGNKQTNSIVRVRKRTIPTERPPLLGEVVANFCG